MINKEKKTVEKQVMAQVDVAINVSLKMNKNMDVSA